MDDFNLQNGIQRATGSEELDALQQRELRSEQMQYYKNANTEPFEGFGGLQGLKEAAIGVAIFLGVALFIKYVLGIG